MKNFKLIIPALLILAGCKKNIHTNLATEDKTLSYIQVTCDNCKIEYGMPDQYRVYNNAGGLSAKFPYTYTSGYTLQMNLTAFVKAQDISVQVFNNDGKSIYNSSENQATSGYWSISLLLPSKSSE